MVSFEEIQAAYYMVAATGVLIAVVVFYILNLRETSKNRKITLTNTMMQVFTTEEGIKRYADLAEMEWSNLDDYLKKYDYRHNRENWIKRASLWNLYENFGRLYREGLIDLETLYCGSIGQIQYIWLKFKPVIEMYRGTEWSKHTYENFEYLAKELNEFHKRKYGEEFFGWRPIEGSDVSSSP